MSDELEALATRLRGKLSESQSEKSAIQMYRKGTMPIKGLNGNTLEILKEHERELAQYRQFMEMAHLNMCPLIVSSVVDDTDIVAFRDADEPSSEADADAQDKWNRMHLSEVFTLAFTDMLHHGDGYGMFDHKTGDILHLPNDICVVETDWLSPWQRTAAYFESEYEGVRRSAMYFRKRDEGGLLLDGVWYTFYTEKDGWSEPELVPRLTRIPIVPCRTTDGQGIYEDHLSTIDRINFMIFSRLVVTDKQSFKELWVSGLPAFIRNEDGTFTPIEWTEEMMTGPGGVNLLPGENTKVTETGSTDPSPLTGAAYADIKNLAALTKTPLYILDPSSAQQSALGADLADKTHRTNVRRLRVPAGMMMAELLSIAFEFEGRKVQLLPVWAPLEDESWGSRAQTAALLRGVLPLESIWSLVLKLSPEEQEAARASLLDAREQGLVSPGGLGDLPDYELERESQDAALIDPEEAPYDPTNANERFKASPLDGGTPGSPKLFLTEYLRSHGGEAPARDVITVGIGKGFSEPSLKMARMRSLPPIRTQRRRVGNRMVAYWILSEQ